MSSNFSLKRDLEELAQMGDKLHEYILGDALYMPVSGGFFRGSSTPAVDHWRLSAATPPLIASQVGA